MKKILIIEDDKDIGFILEMVLSVTYDLMIVRNASGIVALYNQFMPDLIIIDNYVGQKKAAEVVAELRIGGVGHIAPYILFSAAGNIEQLASEIHASAYLPKPFQLSELSFLVEKVLSEQPGPKC